MASECAVLQGFSSIGRGRPAWLREADLGRLGHEWGTPIPLGRAIPVHAVGRNPMSRYGSGEVRVAVRPSSLVGVLFRHLQPRRCGSRACAPPRSRLHQGARHDQARSNPCRPGDVCGDFHRVVVLLLRRLRLRRMRTPGRKGTTGGGVVAALGARTADRASLSARNSRQIRSGQKSAARYSEAAELAHARRTLTPGCGDRLDGGHGHLHGGLRWKRRIWLSNRIDFKQDG